MAVSTTLSKKIGMKTIKNNKQMQENYLVFRHFIGQALCD
jgi:hypothetical protein